MAARIITGDVFDTLPTVRPGSVDVACSSPPYWRLRSYLPKDHPLKRFELGSEPTPAEYVKNQVAVCRLVREALAPHGTLWLNVGDSYSAEAKGNLNGQASSTLTSTRTQMQSPAGLDKRGGVPEGNLCLIPQRLMIALQDDGWFVRSIVVWHKPAPMPTSITGWSWRRHQVKVKSGAVASPGKQGTHPNRTVAALNANTHGDGKAVWTDCPGCKKCEPNGGYVLRRGSWRPTSSYEPVLMLAKSRDYFADGEPVKTEPKAATVNRDQYTRVLDDADEQFAVKHDHETFCDGANLRDVWTIGAEPLKEAHYAAFPTRLVDTILKCSTSAKGYCPTCGKPWVRMIEPFDTGRRQKKGDNWDTGPGAHGTFHRDGSEAGERDQPVMANRTVGWRASCEHRDLEPRPALVLDPFTGSGRTAIAADRLGLDFVGCELNEEYADMARRLIRAECPLFAEVA